MTIDLAITLTIINIFISVVLIIVLKIYGARSKDQERSAVRNEKMAEVIEELDVRLSRKFPQLNEVFEYIQLRTYGAEVGYRANDKAMDALEDRLGNLD